MRVHDIELINIRPVYCKAETWPWNSVWTPAGRFAVDPPGVIEMPKVADWFNWSDLITEPFPAGAGNTEGRLVSVNFKSVFTTACRFLGTEQCLIEKPDLSPITDAYIEYNRRLLEEFGDFCPTLIVGDDVAHNGGMLMSPATWREWIAPEWRRFTDLAREYEGECWLHSDGDIHEILGDIKALGFTKIYSAEALPAMVEAYGAAGGCDRDFPEPIWGER